MENEITSNNVEVQHDTQVADAIDISKEQIVFQGGNLSQCFALPQQIDSKIQKLQYTLLPLVEAALIELLESSNMYTRENAQVSLNLVGDFQIQIYAYLTYKVPRFIGLDVDPNNIATDAKYILDRINVDPTMTITECKIDCTAGTVTIGCTI